MSSSLDPVSTPRIAYGSNKVSFALSFGENTFESVDDALCNNKRNTSQRATNTAALKIPALVICEAFFLLFFDFSEQSSQSQDWSFGTAEKSAFLSEKVIFYIV